MQQETTRNLNLFQFPALCRGRLASSCDGLDGYFVSPYLITFCSCMPFRLQKCAENNRTSERYQTPLHCLSSKLLSNVTRNEPLISVNIPNGSYYKNKSAQWLVKKCVSAADCEAGTPSMSVAIIIRTSFAVYFGTCENWRKKISSLADWLLWQLNGKFLFFDEACHGRWASVNKSRLCWTLNEASLSRLIYSCSCKQ